MNPILSRELRSRFRDKRSYWLLFALTALLAAAAGWIYSTAAWQSTYNPYAPYGTVGGTPSDLARQASQTGRQLFQILAMGNVLAWLLIAPALTATGLAKERERGLLESLWLSPFKVPSQIIGRMGAALSFLLLLQVAVLPIYGVSLVLGGVSPQEIGTGGLIIAAASLFGASLGLWFSARSYRSANALGAVFVVVGVWSFASFSYAQPLLNGASSIDEISYAIVFSHPVAQMAALLNPQMFMRGGTAAGFSADTAYRTGWSIQFLLTFLLLWSATRKASKALPDQPWREGNQRIKRWRANFEAAKKEREERRERQRAREKVAGAMLHELPIEKLVRFKDPILSREIRGRFRLRQSGFIVKLGRFGAFVTVAGFWLYVLFSSFDFSTRGSTGLLLLYGLLIFGLLAVAVMSSTSLVKEREGGTWEGLYLSLLPKAPMIRSKWISPIITFGYWSAPLWLLLPLCSRWDGTNGLDLMGLLSAVLIILIGLCAVSAWGLWISSRAPHSAAATSWTLGSLLVILVGLPILDEFLGIYSKVINLLFGTSGDYDPFAYNRYIPSSNPIYSTARDLLVSLKSTNPFRLLEDLLRTNGNSGRSYYSGYSYGYEYAPGLSMSSYVVIWAAVTVVLLWSIVRKVKTIEKE